MFESLYRQKDQPFSGDRIWFICWSGLKVLSCEEDNAGVELKRFVHKLDSLKGKSLLVGWKESEGKADGREEGEIEELIESEGSVEWMTPEEFWLEVEGVGLLEINKDWELE